jgi:radical SAM protein with 4Fe4S-binding SPASM domain
MSILSRVVVPARLALIVRDEQTVGYNARLNVWHRLDGETAEVLRWLRAGRDRDALAGHLSRRFGVRNSEARLEAVLRWATLRQLLHLDSEPTPPAVTLPTTPPATIYWICTQACNLRCTYCYQDATVARPAELSTVEGCDLVDQAVEAGARTFIFTGGEPFHRRDLLKIARYSKSRGLRTNVITNGSHITPRTIRDVAQAFDKVTVSLDHAVAAHHDAARGKGSWRRAATAIDLLIREGMPIDVNSVLTRSGLRDIPQLLAYIRSRHVDQHRLTPRYPMGRGGDDRDDELTPEELLELEDNLHRAAETLEAVPAGNGDSGDSGAGRPTGTSNKGVHRAHCGAGLSEVSVDPEGWVYPCRLLQKTEYRAGNVRNRRLADIIARDATLAGFRRPFVETLQPCTTCIIRNSCGGGCRGIHSSFSQSWTVAEPLFCAQLRREFETKVFADTGSVPARKPARFVRADGAHVAPGPSPAMGTLIPAHQLIRRA